MFNNQYPAYAKAEADYRQERMRRGVAGGRRRARRLYEAETAELLKHSR